MIVPFPVLLQSHIQTRKKLVLLGLFGLGVFITVIQIIRIQTVKRLANYTDSAPLILWSAVENNLGVIVASIPTLSPLIKYFNERTRGNTSGQSSGGWPGGTDNAHGSHYNMQTWKSNKGRQQLSSHNDPEVTKGDSTEFILDTTGITRTIQVSVTSA
jgi:hypothetical protein